MIEVLNKLSFYMEYPFVRYALFVGVLIALCSSLLGVVLVLKRYYFIGNGLSSFAFLITAITVVLNIISEMIFVLPITIICAVFLLRKGENSKIKGDAALAMLSTGCLAIGYLIINVFSQSANVSADVCATLFGSTSILTLSKSDVLICIVLSIVVVVMFVLFYNKIFAITFDETFASATGTNVDLYNLIIAVIIAVVIVLAMNLVGSLLVSALVIFPTLSATQIFKNFLSVTICSAVTSVISAFIGIIIAILAGLPVGPTIVAVNVFVFGVFYLIGLKSV